MFNREFNYKITRNIAVLSENPTGTKELNLISYNGAPVKYDLRNWGIDDTGKKKMLKGLTLNAEEIDRLRDALNELKEG